MKDIKEAFERVKLDIFYLNENLYSLIEEVSNIRRDLNKISLETKKERIDPFNLFLKPFFPKKYSFHFNLDNKTHLSTGNEGVQTNSTHIETDKPIFKPLNTQIQSISIGNEGVKTNRQTHKQTDKEHLKSSYNQNNFNTKKDLNSQNKEKSIFNETQEILNSLDSLKKELRLKFKRLTNQELLVFSAVYQLEEEYGYSDYKMLSKRLKLTESSIRDYVRRLITKKIPLEKRKVNNKEINLFISPNLKKILPLDSLLRLVNL